MMQGKVRSWMVLVMSHGIALIVGWCLVKTFASDQRVVDLSNSVASKSNTRTHSSRVRMRGQADHPGYELLLQMMDQADDQQDLLEMAPAANRAAAARAALDGWAEAGCPLDKRREVFARFYQWLEVAPKDALAYWGGSGVGGLAKAESQMVESALGAVSITQLSAWLRPPSELRANAAVDPVIARLSTMIAESSKVKLLDDVLDEISEPVRGRLGVAIIGRWPVEKLSQLDGLISRVMDAGLLRAYLDRMPSSDRVSWLSKAMDTQPALAELLSKSRIAEESLYGATGGSLDQRLAMIAQLAAANGKPPPQESLRVQLLTRDVAEWMQRVEGMDDGALSDWRYRMRMGKLSGQELLGMAKQELPAHAASNPAELRAAVFEGLARVNANEAMQVISDLPLADREKLVIRTATGIASAGDAQQVSELLALRPATQSSSANERFQVWCTASDPGVKNFGDSYATWVMAMPQGLDRDMALSALAARVELTDPEQAAKLRAAKTLPVGWRPGKS